MPFGKTDFAESDLAANLAALTACIEKNRPVGCKGRRGMRHTRTTRSPPLSECVPPRGAQAVEDGDAVLDDGAAAQARYQCAARLRDRGGGRLGEA